MMASRKTVLDKNKQQLLDSVNASNKIYTNEELSILISEQADLIDKQATKIRNLEIRVDKNVTSINSINSNWAQRFESISNSNYLPYSCGANNATIKRMIQDYWDEFLINFSAKHMSAYGCRFMVYINKDSSSYGTVILTGYTWNGMAIGNLAAGTWTWTTK